MLIFQVNKGFFPDCRPQLTFQSKAQYLTQYYFISFAQGLLSIIPSTHLLIKLIEIQYFRQNPCYSTFLLKLFLHCAPLLLIPHRVQNLYSNNL